MKYLLLLTLISLNVATAQTKGFNVALHNRASDAIYDNPIGQYSLARIWLLYATPEGNLADWRTYCLTYQTIEACHYDILATNKRLLDRELSLVSQAKLKAVIDLHWYEGFTKPFQSSVTTDQALDYWRQIFILYGKDSRIAAFDFVNEPLIKNKRHLNIYNRTLKKWQRLAYSLDIRQKLWLPAPNINSRNLLTWKPPPKRPQDSYTFHLYDFFNRETCTRQQVEKIFSRLSAWQSKNGRLVIGEYGVLNFDENCYKEISDACARHNITCLVWDKRNV